MRREPRVGLHPPLAERGTVHGSAIHRRDYVAWQDQYMYKRRSGLLFTVLLTSGCLGFLMVWLTLRDVAGPIWGWPLAVVGYGIAIAATVMLVRLAHARFRDEEL